METTDLEASGITAGMPTLGHPTIRVKHNFSRQHLIAARWFAQLAGKAEEQAEVTDALRSEHTACVTGAVVFSVAFLEASINELYLEAVDGNRNALAGLSDTHIAILAELWETVEQVPVLSKFQIALAACGRPQFLKGDNLYQGAASLTKIRNALIHYRPEWHDELTEHKKIKERVARRFCLSPFAAPGQLWFPHQCLSAGCARWGVEQVELFTTEFCQRLEIPNRLPTSAQQNSRGLTAG